MKFNNVLKTIVKKSSIDKSLWFDYKKIKKEIKIVKKINISCANTKDGSCCCICLENFTQKKDVILLGCCNNDIHVCCFVNTMCRIQNTECFLCRTKLQDILATTNKNDLVILRIISLMMIELDKIETYLKKRHGEVGIFTNRKDIKLYTLYNFIAYLKILKKINKNGINIFNHFVSIIMRNRILYKKGVQYLQKYKEYSKYLYLLNDTNMSIS